MSAQKDFLDEIDSALLLTSDFGYSHKRYVRVVDSHLSTYGCPGFGVKTAVGEKQNLNAKPLWIDEGLKMNK